MTNEFEEVPSLDLHSFTKGDVNEKLAFSNALGEAYSKIGFVAIKNHGLSTQLQDQLYSTSKDLFSLPDDIKTKYEREDLHGQRGYIGKKKEHAKDSNQGDLKEFYHIGQPNYGENIWPEEIPEFKNITLETYETLEKTGLILLEAIALYLRLPENYFENKVAKGNSILRLIHYYPINDVNDAEEGAVRAAAHGDINLITLLMGASAEGLELLRKDGKWIPVTALPDHIIVNVGDMLERLTNDKLTSTIHRVVNPSPEKMLTPRYSIPFFMHPKPDMDLSCLEQCIDDKNPKKHRDITAGDFLNQRLKEIGLKS